MRRIDTRNRANQEEIMDDFSMESKQLKQVFRELDKVNGLLGGTVITLNGLKKLLNTTSKDRPFKILDIGCGNGFMLRTIAKYGQKHGLNFSLLGIDANPEAINIARIQSTGYHNIEYDCINVHSERFSYLQADIILCTLTLHHFKDQEIIKLMNTAIKNAHMGIVVNDLQRSAIAFHLFNLFCAVFIKNSIAKQDGQVSILRSFKRKDFNRYSSYFPSVRHEINWKWAFRYQWIIYKIKSGRGQ